MFTHIGICPDNRISDSKHAERLIILTKHLLIFVDLKTSVPSSEIREICVVLQMPNSQRFIKNSALSPVFPSAIEYRMAGREGLNRGAIGLLPHCR